MLFIRCFYTMLDDLKIGIGNNVARNIGNILPYCSSFSRGLAFVIDFAFLLLPRLLFGLIYSFTCDKYRLDFLEQVLIKYGKYENFTFATREQLRFFLESRYAMSMFIMLFFMIIISIIYQIIMLCSSWQATIGQRALKIKTINTEEPQRLGIFDAIVRIIFSYIPWFLPIFIPIFWKDNIVIAVALLIILAFWYDLGKLLGKRIALHDFLSGTRLVNGYNKTKFYLFRNA